MQRQTQLANELWPLLLPRFERLLTQAGAGGGGGAATLAVHDLAGANHRGALADDQGPQFLLRNGTRSLTGNLAVDPGVTIDGVDISENIHPRLHAITSALDHTVTGNQYQIVGLTGVNTLGLLTPSAAPGANTVVRTNANQGVQLVDATVTANLYMDGVLDFGTNYIDEDATYLQFSGSKAVKFNQNIGSGNWTIYSTGGASFGGAVDIINGGDLTVIGSGAYAGVQVLMVDSSGGNVGVNRAPDPQFALDIAGPARAEYWIGPHAIQLKNVLLLAHYDGRLPAETNYSGEPNGHMGQVATVNGGVIFRPGKFYKALQAAGPATNCIVNPSVETDTTGWGVAGGAAIQHMANFGYVGTRCVRLYGAANGFANISATATTSAGGTYTFSVYVAGSGQFRLRLYDNVTGYQQSSVFTATADWTRFTLTATFHATSTDRQCGLLSTNGVEIYFDAAQLEAGAAATPYLDGALGDGHAWTGTAHASSSTRAEGRLTYSANGNIKTEAGTVMAWVRKCNLAHTMALLAGDAAGSLDIYTGGNAINVERRGIQNVISHSYAWPVEQWVHVAVTWSGTAVTLYVNGAAAATGTAGGVFAMPSTLLVGRRSDAQYNWGGWIDDLCILGYASPADEIRSIYESNAPVFAETSVYVFRVTPKGLVWGDDEGLWVRDTVGNPVLGIYGGEAATKSWGSFNMAAGDIVFGRNAVGSSAIWWKRAEGTFGFYGAGNASPQVQIGTDGVLYVGTAGAARVEMRATQLAGYDAANQLQWWGSTTDGIFYAGGGNAAISRYGYMVESTPNEPSFAWPFAWGGLHVVGDVATPDTGWRSSIVFGEPTLVYAPSAPRIRSWLFEFAGDLTATPPASGQYSVADFALIVQDVAGHTWRVWHEGNLAPARLDAPAAFAGVVSAPTLRATGDSGGVAGVVSFTNATNATQSSGTGSIRLTGTTNRNNTGFLKIWVAGTAMWIPYFADIS